MSSEAKLLVIELLRHKVLPLSPENEALPRLDTVDPAEIRVRWHQNPKPDSWNRRCTLGIRLRVLHLSRNASRMQVYSRSHQFPRM